MCHEAHASPNHRLLKSSYPGAFYSSYSRDKYICFNCHEEAAFSEPRTTSATAFRNGNLNLHYRHVNRKKGRTCRACHHHHSAENPKLIRENVPFGDRVITIKEFELTETGGKCGPTCHRVARYDRIEAVQNAFKVTERQDDVAATGVSSDDKQEQLMQ
jgi:predicted CXXCH cytochrome family protein